MIIAATAKLMSPALVKESPVKKTTASEGLVAKRGTGLELPKEQKQLLIPKMRRETQET